MRLPTPLGGATPPPPPSDEETDPAASKKRKAADALGEVLDMADSFRVCPICWVPHPEAECPRRSESQTLIQTYLHMQHGGKPIEVSRLVEERRDTDVVMGPPNDSPESWYNTPGSGESINGLSWHFRKAEGPPNP